MRNKFWICVLLLTVITQDCTSQEEDDDEGPYRGLLIGKFNSYHHQVSGWVYAVDDRRLRLWAFSYDGGSDDAFFWAGDAPRPGPQGFILPDHRNITNVLERYNNEEVVLTLPEGKRVSQLKWFAVYDISAQSVHGDVEFPPDLAVPAPRPLPPLIASPRDGTELSSDGVTLLDDNTILVRNLRVRSGGARWQFRAGAGPQPSRHGYTLPDNFGYLDGLGEYSDEDVRLSLPGGRSLRAAGWLAVWDTVGGRSVAGLALPHPLNVPPAPAHTLPYKSPLPRCKQLHRDVQVSWEIFGNQITVHLAAKMAEDEYVAFGLSGSRSSSKMVGADIVVAYWDQRAQRGIARDYNVSDYAPCVSVLGSRRGVCPDAVVGGRDSVQLLEGARRDGLTTITYRRTLKPDEEMDREFETESPQHVVWAVGSLDEEGEPAYHRLRPANDLALTLAGPAGDDDDCFPFTMMSEPPPTPWEVATLSDPSVRVFEFRLGPSGGERGLGGRGRGAPELAWYVRGQLAPDIVLRRGLTYTLQVRGGNAPHSARLYHPLVVGTERRGGPDLLPDHQQKQLRLLAGVHTTRRGRLAPTAAGPLCVARETSARRAVQFPTFRLYNRTLAWNCSSAPPALLTVTPDTSWPDVVYYNSFTHTGMGGRMLVVDKSRRAPRPSASGVPPRASLAAGLLLPLLLLPL